MRFTAPRVIVLDGDALEHPRGACPPFAALSLALIVLDGNAFKHPWGACPPLIFRDAHPPLISTSIHPNDRRPRSPVNYKAHIPFSFPPATPSGSSATAAARATANSSDSSVLQSAKARNNQLPFQPMAKNDSVPLSCLNLVTSLKNCR